MEQFEAIYFITLRCCSGNVAYSAVFLSKGKWACSSLLALPFRLGTGKAMNTECKISGSCLNLTGTLPRTQGLKRLRGAISTCIQLLAYTTSDEPFFICNSQAAYYQIF